MITDIKNAIKNTLKGVTGIGTIYNNFPRTQNQTDFPAVVIDIMRIHEKRIGMGNPGKRHIYYTASLFIQTIDPTPDEQASQKTFDDLLDNIDNALRSDKSLGGLVLQSAWEYIDTEKIQPTLSGNGLAVTLRAIKTFDVTVEIMG